MLSEMKRTHRGFRLYTFEDRNNNPCSFQKSSIATEDCIWLGLDSANPKILHSDAKKLGVDTEATCGWIDYHVPEEVSLDTRMHLNQDQAKELAKQLLIFAETGELPRVVRT